MRHAPLAVDQLGSIPLLNGIDAAVLAPTAQSCEQLWLDRGEQLFRQGTPATGFYYLAAGRIQLSVTAHSGGVATVELIGEGETFGEAVVFLNKPYPVTARALEASHTYFISAECIDSLLATDAVVARRLLANMALRAHRLVSDIATMTLSSAVGRVQEFLLQLLPTPLDDAPRVVTLPSAKYLIASRLGLTAETFSRALRQLSESGDITVHGNQIIIANPAALAAKPE